MKLFSCGTCSHVCECLGMCPSGSRESLCPGRSTDTPPTPPSPAFDSSWGLLGA